MRETNLVCGSLTRWPRLCSNIHGAIARDSIESTTAVTAPNREQPGRSEANTTPSASTVPRSLMKQAARMILPISVLLNPVSIITA